MNSGVAGSTGGNPPVEQIGIKKQLLQGVLFWERGRCLFNVGLLAALLFCLLDRWPNSLHILSGPESLGLLKGLGWLNLAYFAGYLIELFLLIPWFRLWTEALRWTVLGIGIALGFFLLYLHLEIASIWPALTDG